MYAYKAWTGQRRSEDKRTKMNNKKGKEKKGGKEGWSEKKVMNELHRENRKHRLSLIHFVCPFLSIHAPLAMLLDNTPRRHPFAMPLCISPSAAAVAITEILTVAPPRLSLPCPNNSCAFKHAEGRAGWPWVRPELFAKRKGDTVKRAVRLTALGKGLEKTWKRYTRAPPHIFGTRTTQRWCWSPQVAKSPKRPNPHKSSLQKPRLSRYAFQFFNVCTKISRKFEENCYAAFIKCENALKLHVRESAKLRLYANCTEHVKGTWKGAWKGTWPLGCSTSNRPAIWHRRKR